MRTPLAVSAALVGVLLLAACGTEVSGARQSPGANDGPGPASTTACGVPGVPAGTEKEGVEITAVSGGTAGCGTSVPSGMLKVHFQVTNHEAEALTYTVEFGLVSASGEALDNASRTVAGVGPGRTSQSTLDIAPVSRHGAGAHVRVEKVTSVPAAEAPSPSGPCPPSGVRVTADRGDAAMGLRVVGLHLENCSTRPYRISGYPQIQLLDLRRRPVTGVSVLHGSGGISTGTDFDLPPKALTLQPGESATSGLMWRNTVTYGTNVNVPYVRIHARPGAQPVMVTPQLDLGTTGKLGVSPWQKADAGR